MLRGAGWVRRAARQSWKLFASCDEFSECGRPRPQQLQRGLRFGITSTRVAVRRFCARGRAHSVWLRLCRAEVLAAFGALCWERVQALLAIERTRPGRWQKGADKN